ncbi:MAG TPA: glycerol-3-phosphate dehydrogenase/oxidase [Terriglobales bacterium]|nr:glycerol-3-phosphate dehydrogenase/oxidase [Terriglobales bacterium]
MQDPGPKRAATASACDVLVVGGGINGVAIARQCALAGRKTVLVEQHDFAAGTTSRSTRIIHGGLRYLEHGEIGLVRESLRERGRLLQERPHLVKPIHFLLALNGNSSRSALEIRFGLWLYRRFAGSMRNGHGDLHRFESLLDSGRRWRLFNYEDAQCEFPERLVAEWLGDAVAAGAVARNHTQVLAVENMDGRVRRVLLRDMNGADEWLEAGWIINATGPWADRFAEQCGIRTQERMIGGVRGSHIVLPNFTGAPRTAVYTEALDHRPIFVVPWNGQLLVGTTEVRDAGDPARTRPSTEEIEYLLGSVQHMFPAAKITAGDIRYAFAGVRPLPYSPESEASAVSRRHWLRNHAEEGAQNVISVIGGKLTTAASLARECADAIGVRAADPSHTWIPGPPDADFDSLLGRFAARIAGEGRMSEPSAQAIVEWFGPHALAIAELTRNDERCRAPLCPHSTHIVAEAVHAFRAESAATLADVLLRRVPVALSACWSDECSRVAAQRVGEVLGWEESRVASECEKFEMERENFLLKQVAVELRH